MVKRCVDLLDGGDVDPEFLVTLGGTPATHLLATGIPEHQQYWVRVWAMRGLLWATPGEAVDALRRGLADSHWRVREMACKVAARHGVGEVLDAVTAAESDTNMRVRSAASRAGRRIVAGSA